MEVDELRQQLEEERAKSLRLQQELDEAIISLDEEKWLTEKQKDEMAKLERALAELMREKELQPRASSKESVESPTAERPSTDTNDIFEEAQSQGGGPAADSVDVKGHETGSQEEAVPCAMEKENMALNQELNLTKDQLRHAAYEVTRLTEIRTSLEERCETFKNCIDSLRVQVAVAEKASTEARQARETVTSLQEEKKMLVEQCQQLGSAAEELKSQLESQQVACSEAHKLLERAKADCILANEMANDLQSKLEVCQASLQEKSKHEEELSLEVAEIKLEAEAKCSVNNELYAQLQTFQVQEEIVSNLVNEWQRDSDAMACNDCKVVFSTTNRRHHCRICGKIFCGTCTSTRHKLVLSRKPAKVCIACFQLLVKYAGQTQTRAQRQPMIQD